MRAQIIVLLLLIGPLSIHAQFTKGDKYFSSFALPERSFLYNDYTTVNADHAELSLQRDNRSQSQFLLGVFAEYGSFRSSQWLLGSGFALGVYSELDFTTPFIGLAPFARHYLSANTGPSRFFMELQVETFILHDQGGLVASAGGDLKFGLTQLLNQSIALDSYLGVSRGGVFGQTGTSLLLGTQMSVYLTKERYHQRFQSSSGIQQGTIMLGGTSSALNWNPAGEKNFNTERFSLAISPNVYYFFTNQLAVGTGVTLTHDSFSLKSDDDSFSSSSTATQIAVTPQVRCYLSDPGARQQWFLSTGVAFTRQQIKSEFLLPGTQSIFDETTDRTEWALGAGLNSFITPHLALELGPNLRYEIGGDSYRLGFDIGLQYFVGSVGE